MNFHRPWTIFALDAEHDAYGMARIAQAHNTCMSELASARAERDNACTALCPHGLDIAAKYENAKRELAAAQARVAELTADILEDAKLRKIAYDQRDKAEADLAAKDATLGEMTALARKAEADLAAARSVLFEWQAAHRIAVDRATKAEADLAAARDEAKINEDALQSACVKALNERDALRADLAAARARNKECDLLLSRVLHELAGSASLCWEPKPTGVFATELALGFVEDAINELRTALAGQRREGE